MEVDGLLPDAAKTLLVDVTVVFPLAASYWKAAIGNPEAVTRGREMAKSVKYAAELAKLDPKTTLFKGAAIDTFGGFGPNFKRVFDLVVGAYNKSRTFVPLNFTARTFKSYLRQRLAVVLARGNARRVRLVVSPPASG